MVEFLTTRGSSAEIEKVVDTAEKEIFIISPFLKIHPIYIEKLEHASRRSVKVSIIFGKRDMDRDVYFSLTKRIKNLNLRAYEELHAKCYYNEKRMVLTSMNLYTYSEEHNREMGVLIEKGKDNDLWLQAHREASQIVYNARPIKFNVKAPSLSSKQNKKPTKAYQDTKVGIISGIKDFISGNGYCIRCGYGISYNPEKPFCEKCFKGWNRYKNKNYEEKFCHSCKGRAIHLSMIKPLCADCY